MKPFPELPYDAAPVWCYPFAECGMYLLFIFCLIHAVKKGQKDIYYLFGGLLFGLLLEYMEVLMGSYTYGRFWVMLGKAPMNIPLCIGVGWGIIMYSARLFTDKLGMTLWAAAALDTLLALNIDLSMDVVAYRTHMWHWDWSRTSLNPLTAQWFGIPYGNFVGWQTVVFCYSAFSRIYERHLLKSKTSGLRFMLIAFLALFSSIIILFLTEEIWPLLSKAGIMSVHRFAGICVILIILVTAGWKKRRIDGQKLPAIVWWVPGWFHIFFTGCFFILGFYQENHWMTIAAIVNLLFGLFIHLLPRADRKI